MMMIMMISSSSSGGGGSGSGNGSGSGSGSSSSYNSNNSSVSVIWSARDMFSVCCSSDGDKTIIGGISIFAFWDHLSAAYRHE